MIPPASLIFFAAICTPYSKSGPPSAAGPTREAIAIGSVDFAAMPPLLEPALLLLPAVLLPPAVLLVSELLLLDPQPAVTITTAAAAAGTSKRSGLRHRYATSSFTR